MPRDPMEVVVRNLFAVQRAANAMGDDVQALVYELFEEVAGLISKVDPTGPSLQRYRLQRLERLLDEINALVGPTFDEVAKVTADHMVALGRQQAEAAVLHLEAILGAGNKGAVEVVKVTAAQLRAIVREDPIEGAVLRDWFRSQSDRTKFQVKRQLQLGMTNAETIGDMVRRVRGRFAGYETIGGRKVPRYTGGVLATTTREATAIARTAANHISNAAALDVFKGNADILSGVEWTATLDARTCPECGAMDGKRWKLDDPKLRRPPLHPQDRCILVPVVDWQGLGMEPPDEGTRATAIDPKTGKPGQVPSDLKYERWLHAQPAALQDSILGPARGRLFRDGKVTLSQLVRSDGTRVRLDALRDAA